MTTYHMNKKDCSVSDQHVLMEILAAGKYTMLSLCRGTEPYVVTMNYGFDREKNALYFHTSEKGLKMEFIKENPRVCGTVIEDRGYMMGKCDHAYRSVVFWGNLVPVEEMAEKKHGMDVLLHHLEDNPAPLKERLLKDDRIYTKRNMAVLRLDITEITGKQGS